MNKELILFQSTNFVQFIQPNLNFASQDHAGIFTLAQKGQSLRDLIPFAIETFGGFGNIAMSFVDRLSVFAAANKGTAKKLEKRQMIQRISFVCQRKKFHYDAGS